MKQFKRLGKSFGRPAAWLSPALCALALATGCDRSKGLETLQGMALVKVADVDQMNKQQAFSALASLGITAQNDPSDAEGIDVFNVDIDRAKAVLQQDSEKNNYTIYFSN